LSKAKKGALSNSSSAKTKAQTPAAPNPAPASSGSQDAVRTFENFHRNITNRNLRAAYNTLGSEMQSQMTYEGWAPGFNTTVSSTPLNVEVQSATQDRVAVTYTLRAVDNPGGTRYFNGRAVLTRHGSVWKIDEIVTNRTLLIAAIEAAFQTEYPAAVEQDFPRGVMEALLIQHPSEKGLSSFCWYMAADGSLVIYYPDSVLASYAAGDFTLTIARQDAPRLFTAAYPME